MYLLTAFTGINFQSSCVIEESSGGSGKPLNPIAESKFKASKTTFSQGLNCDAMVKTLQALSPEEFASKFKKHLPTLRDIFSGKVRSISHNYTIFISIYFIDKH